MAGWFTHLLVAFDALQKLPKSKRSLLSEPAHFDDYLFGAIAPDIRYIANADRDITHEPKGEQSAFAAFNSSAPFVAGYESHLITDAEWGRVAKFFRIDTTKLEQNFALYFAVDRYFRAKAGWFMSVMFSGNIAKADNITFLGTLGFDAGQASSYKSLVSSYLVAQDAVSFLSFLPGLPFPANEKIVVTILDSLVVPAKKLNSFFSASINASAKEIARKL